MITKIKIDGFKSFQNFEMEFTPFTIIAGLNASGKSNLFDALELLSRLAQYTLRDAFSLNRGSVNEMFSLVGDTAMDSMTFEVEMLVERTNKDNWGITKEINNPRLRYELHIKRIKNARGYEELIVTYESLGKIRSSDDKWTKSYIPKDFSSLWKSTQSGGSSKPFIQTETKNNVQTIVLRQDSGQGGKNTPVNTINQTVLSSVNDNNFPHVFAAKMEMMNWKFMQLNPEELRKPTEKNAIMSDVIAHDGANLAAALDRLKQDDEYNLTEISRELSRFLPDVTAVDVEFDQARELLSVILINKNGEKFTSRVLSEGTLRLLALTIIMHDNRHKGLLCFEEPENGIHPARIKQMAELLYDLSAIYDSEDTSLRQVVVNTHSPILIKELNNYQETKAISIWLSKMSTSVFHENKKKMRVTQMSRVLNSNQTSLNYSPEERRTSADLQAYLSSTTTENGE